jgi:hypothetical protein
VKTVSVETISLIYSVWREVKREFRSELREKGIRRARLPRLAVFHDIDGAIAYYHVKTNTIAVSARKIEEAAERHSIDVKCVAKSILYHELAHYFRSVFSESSDYDSEEREAEAWELTALATCVH